MAQSPGTIVLFGSGETSSTGRKVYEWVFSRLPAPVRVALLETPAGFQPNSAIVAQKVADFIRERLQNYRPETVVVPARRRGASFGTDDPETLAPLLQANALFMGPGSPTYAVRQLTESLAWEYLQAKQRSGAALILASAATVAASACCLPVYEIYKSGEDVHWRKGLDLFGPFGLSLTMVPHWDNVEGGAELDTSRCFMGQTRFAQLLDLLPAKATVVGIDEHTAMVVDMASGVCRVMGRGVITVLASGRESRHISGQAFPLEELGDFHLPSDSDDISPQVWHRVTTSPDAPGVSDAPPPELIALVESRQTARALSDWQEADALRQQIAGLGWRVVDTPDGPTLEAQE